MRLVDIRSTRYAIARRYMIRLRRDDFADPHELARFAATARMTLQEFREQFGYLIESEPPSLVLELAKPKPVAAAKAETKAETKAEAKAGRAGGGGA